jgi:hypothetical protein
VSEWVSGVGVGVGVWVVVWMGVGVVRLWWNGGREIGGRNDRGDVGVRVMVRVGLG